MNNSMLDTPRGLTKVFTSNNNKNSFSIFSIGENGKQASLCSR